MTLAMLSTNLSGVLLAFLSRAGYFRSLLIFKVRSLGQREVPDVFTESSSCGNCFKKLVAKDAFRVCIPV